ncbi:MAG: hypothetical protein AB7F78_20710 [Hyphomicrobiaceae bacterium]
MSILRLAFVLIASLAVTQVAMAADELGYRVHTKAGKFEDVRDDLKDAIVNRGFVIDYVGHFNAMLERTAEATGSVTPLGAKSPYKQAEYMQFCPSKLTHEAVSATPFAIANCPIAIFVYETGAEPGKIQVGYRLPAATPSKVLRKVNDKLTALLDGIAKEVTKK